MNNRTPDAWDYIGYFAAAAILIPIGIWLKDTGIVTEMLAPLFSYY